MHAKLSFLVAAATAALLFAAPSFAAPIRYEFDSGFVTLTASVGGVAIADPVTASLSGTQVTIDEDPMAPQLVSIQLDVAGPIPIVLTTPYAGYDDIVLESLSLSGSSGLLVPLTPGPPTAEYFFLVNPLAIDAVVSADGPPPIESLAVGTEAPASGSLFVSSELNQLSLSGITIGSFAPFGVDSPPLVVKADFVFSGSPIPEPNAALLFLVGTLTLTSWTRSKRT